MSDDTKVIFGVAPNGTGDGVPLVILGIPQTAWDYIKDGKTNTLDLTKVGLNVKLVLFGAPSQDAAMKMLNTDRATQDRRNEDFSIGYHRTDDAED